LFINCGHFEFIIYKQKYFLKLNFFQKILLKYSSKLDGWSNDSEIYVLNYSLGSKGYELKVLTAEDSLIINLMVFLIFFIDSLYFVNLFSF